MTEKVIVYRSIVEQRVDEGLIHVLESPYLFPAIVALAMFIVGAHLADEILMSKRFTWLSNKISRHDGKFQLIIGFIFAFFTFNFMI